MHSVGVIHLVRAGEKSIEYFQHFIKSYKDNTAGISHELIVVFKGFNKDNNLQVYYELLKGLSFQEIFVEDKGFDIGTYFLVSKRFAFDYYIFLNSYSIILVKDWLLKLYTQMIKQHVGLIGVSGSCESSYSVFSDQVLMSIKGQSGKNILRTLYLKMALMRFWYDFPPFPNYHLRTNGFLISGSIMRSIKFKNNPSRRDVLKFESGRNSLTNQILRKNLKVLVVDNHGVAYEKEDWYNSQTFRQMEQANLMIADNRTREYANGDNETKERLSRIAWGNKSRVK